MTYRTHSTGDCAGEPLRPQGAHAARRDELCMLPLAERIAHFSKRRAYQMPDGEALRMQPPKPLPKLNASGFTRDAADVFRLRKTVIGLPCLGIFTARYLHGRRDYLIGQTGKVHLTRCHRCDLKDLCERMCDEQLHHSGDVVAGAWRRFMDFGGWSAVVKGWSSKDRRRSPAVARLQELVQAVQATGVTFANDADMREYIEGRAERENASAAERQQKSRLLRAAEAEETQQNGQPPCSTSLLAEAKTLEERIRRAKEASGCPRWLARVDARFVARVWSVKESLASRDDKNGATHIARVLAKATPGVDHDALRKRVSRVVKVFPLLEKLP